jgi:hypothetical protein
LGMERHFLSRSMASAPGRGGRRGNGEGSTGGPLSIFSKKFFGILFCFPSNLRSLIMNFLVSGRADLRLGAWRANIEDRRINRGDPYRFFFEIFSELKFVFWVI